MDHLLFKEIIPAQFREFAEKCGGNGRAQVFVAFSDEDKGTKLVFLYYILSVKEALQILGAFFVEICFDIAFFVLAFEGFFD